MRSYKKAAYRRGRRAPLDAALDAAFDSALDLRGPRNPPAHLEGAARKARHPGAFSFGYFSLLRASCPPPFGPASPFARARSACVGKQRKVTWPPAGGRKPAAGEPDRDDTTNERKVISLTSLRLLNSASGKRRDDEQKKTAALPDDEARLAPHPNPLPAGEREYKSQAASASYGTPPSRTNAITS